MNARHCSQFPCIMQASYHLKLTHAVRRYRSADSRHVVAPISPCPPSFALASLSRYDIRSLIRELFHVSARSLEILRATRAAVIRTIIHAFSRISAIVPNAPVRRRARPKDRLGSLGAIGNRISETGFRRAPSRLYLRRAKNKPLIYRDDDIRSRVYFRHIVVFFVFLVVGLPSNLGIIIFPRPGDTSTHSSVEDRIRAYSWR